MLYNKKNCIEDFCRYCTYDANTDEYDCKLELEIKDEDCDYFEPRQRCDDCAYAKVITFETGLIDEVDYYCKLQGDALIYEDVTFEPSDSRWPDCPIDSFKEKHYDG